MAYGVLFDLDGTLVDTNYLHVVAWSDAFESGGYTVPMTTIHGLIGQGSDRLVDSAIGHPDDAVAEAHDDFYASRLHNLRAFDKAAALLRRTKSEGLKVILATSASAHDAPFLRAAVQADDAIDHATTSDDAHSSKPEPDIVNAALDAADLRADDCVFVGDTVWEFRQQTEPG